MTRTLILDSYEDNEGEIHRASAPVLRALKEALGAAEIPETKPARGAAFLPENPRASGLALQLYALRREGDWGIGDFTALGEVMDWATRQGLRFVGLNPLHALRTAHPSACSPYYPSSRLALQPLYIDVPRLAEDLGETVEEPGIDAGGALIDYPAVSEAKLSALRSLFGRADLGRELEGFEQAAGADILGHALHEAYDHVYGTPPPFRPGTDEASAFREEHGEEVAFHLFLQWAADRQLRRAAARGGGTCTLYLDLAVGSAPGGSEAWAKPSAYVPSVRLGAPPDLMAPRGQDWGLVPLHPVTLAREGGASFARILDASAKYSGALRIDHALGMNRQYFIPAGFHSAEATYVRFPQDVMLSTIARVSRDRRCVMIGEDLGTVPEGLTEALHDAKILSYEVTRWSRHEDGAFLQQEEYPTLCLAAATTHDIAPIAGWLGGSDIDTRLRVGHLDKDRLEGELSGRGEEREGLLDLWKVPNRSRKDPDAVVRAAHAFLKGTNALIAMMAVEDLLLQEGMMNLPGTLDEHPNWRRRYASPLSEWTEDEAVLQRLESGLR